MRISYNWLKEFVSFEETPEQLCRMLTFLGLETTILEGGAYAWKKVITARVSDVTKHPNADKLSLCSLSDGNQNYSVVCGAPNVANGQIVALALIGAELPNGIKIKRAKIRGVESEGMICSERELGLSTESSGIMVLPQETPLGEPLEDILGEKDTILEVEITTNRPDCLSHWGVAREIAAKLHKPLKLPEINRPQIIKPFNLKVENSELCPRYIGVLISGVKVGPSPEWIAKRLEKCGLRPINSIVDITNYVLLELGHPLHAFDQAKLEGDTIIARCAKPGEKIRALDGKEYALTDQMLVIADAVKPQAIAGVMGGEGSGVTEKTTSVVLESALFHPRSIRKTSKTLGISTDASYRFERGTAWEVCTMASWRAIGLIQEIAGGTVEARTDFAEVPCAPVEIRLRPERVKHILGMEFTNDEIRNILEGLGLKVTMVNGTFIADIPTWRLDLRQEIDLIEELARIKGYENVPVTVMPVVPRLDESKHIKPAEEILRERLIGLGFCEAMNYSFAQESELRGFGLNVSVRIANPLSKENEVLRPSLIAGLWKNFNLNINQGFSAIKLFETGNIFPETGERKSLGFVVYGPVWPEWWGWEARKITVPKIDFYFLNGIAIALFNGNTFSITSSGSYLPFLHPGKSALFELNGRPVGQFGILRPEYGNGLTGEIGYGEFDLDAVEKCWNRQVPQYHALRRYPPVKRDISLLARKDIPFDKIMKVINDFIIQGSLLREFNLFSIYEDEKIGTDKISYSFHLIFRHPEHTLKDAEVNAQTEGILERLARELGVTLRA